MIKKALYFWGKTHNPLKNWQMCEPLQKKVSRNFLERYYPFQQNNLMKQYLAPNLWQKLLYLFL